MAATPDISCDRRIDIVLTNPIRIQPRKFLMVCALVMSLAWSSGDSQAGDKSTRREICVTFNELPVSQAFDTVDRVAVTKQLLEVLDRHQVIAVGFVVGEKIDNSYDLLGQWLNAGHQLGNLTYSHQNLHEMSIEQFIRDITTGSEKLEPMLAGFGQKGRWFRYPFLHYGATVQAKRQIRLYLEAQDLAVAHVTIVIDDYLYNLTLEKISQGNDSTNYEILRYEYISHVLSEVERCETVAREILKRPCRHILQLRANRLNALYLDALLTALMDMGYKFISIDEALRDRLFSMPEAYLGLRGVGYLDMIKESDPDLLPAQ